MFFHNRPFLDKVITLQTAEAITTVNVTKKSAGQSLPLNKKDEEDEKAGKPRTDADT